MREREDGKRKEKGGGTLSPSSIVCYTISQAGANLLHSLFVIEINRETMKDEDVEKKTEKKGKKKKITIAKYWIDRFF